jgi:hypothetical protein
MLDYEIENIRNRKKKQKKKKPIPEANEPRLSLPDLVAGVCDASMSRLGRRIVVPEFYHYSEYFDLRLSMLLRETRIPEHTPLALK